MRRYWVFRRFGASKKFFGGIEMIEAKAKTELPACPVETTLTLIGDKWKVLILRDLMRERSGSGS